MKRRDGKGVIVEAVELTLLPWFRVLIKSALEKQPCEYSQSRRLAGSQRGMS